MHHIISTIPSLTSSSFPVLLKQPHLPSLQFKPPYRRRRITICSPSKPRNSITPSTPRFPRTNNNPFDVFQKTLTAAVFCATIAFFPTYLIPMPATAAPAVAPARVADKTARRRKSTADTDHEYSEQTRRLLAVVAVLLQRIEDAKSGRAKMDHVKEALKEVALKREELQDEILAALNAELEEMENEEKKLMAREKQAVVSFQAMVVRKDDLEWRRGQGEEVKEKIDELEKNMDATEREYNEVIDKLEDIENLMLRKETMAYSIGLRELSFIQRECETLVTVFERERKEVKAESISGRSSTQLSTYDIQKDLEAKQKEYWEQLMLPRAVELEDCGLSLDPVIKNFVSNMLQQFKKSREMQSNLEEKIRQKLRRYGDEKLFIVNTPGNEVVKGFPEVELKWMFGEKEIVVPKAAKLHLYHGWKKWREEAKLGLKRRLLENVESGRQYVAQRQERILLDRDRVVARTWFNDGKDRWEMDPMAVPYAVSKKLVKNVRIRHDWGAMYLELKGEDNDYYVDLREFELLFEDCGGFDGLYLKMLASGIPTAVNWMWIPFSELDIRQKCLSVARLSYQGLVRFWKSVPVSNLRRWCFVYIKNTTEDIMVLIGFPLLEFIIPRQVRMTLGMALPEESSQIVDTSWYLNWQFEAEMNFQAREIEGLGWFLGLFIRSIILVFVFFYVLHFMKRKISRLLGIAPSHRDPDARKLKRLRTYFKFRQKVARDKKKAGFDPIRSAFNNMKRIKNPPIPLKDFSSIDSIKDEVNEIVAFLQNPSAFQEIGARAPRGVLIAGESGTGKTSLALAIAAEAKVPVVEIKARQLEGALWVGQSASHVRELFQMARDLAPVIIFVEDFELFSGVRGKATDTREQEHESFINQLLVELDGFDKQDGVVLLATTSNLSRIDPALQRPGRMDRILFLEPLTQAEREKILRIAAEETMDSELIHFVDWKKVAEKTLLLPPLDLKDIPVSLEGSAFRNKYLDMDELLSYCSWFASVTDIVPKAFWKTKLGKGISKWLINHLGLTLTGEDIQSVVDLMDPYGAVSNGIDLVVPVIDSTREAKFPHAVWAAGRGLIALLLPNFDELEYIWLERASWEHTAFTKITKARSGGLYGNVDTRSHLEKELVLCFGSHIAAQMLLPFGEENYMSQSEIDRAQEIATRMVIQYGWGPDDNLTIYYCEGSETSLSMGDKHQYEMAARVEKMYNLAYDKAKEILQKNRKVLEIIVEQLIEFESLSRKDLLNILEESGAVQEREPFFLSKQHTDELATQSGNASGPAILGARS